MSFDLLHIYLNQQEESYFCSGYLNAKILYQTVPYLSYPFLAGCFCGCHYFITRFTLSSPYFHHGFTQQNDEGICFFLLFIFQ